MRARMVVRRKARLTTLHGHQLKAAFSENNDEQPLIGILPMIKEKFKTIFLRIHDAAQALRTTLVPRWHLSGSNG